MTLQREVRGASILLVRISSEAMFDPLGRAIVDIRDVCEDCGGFIYELDVSDLTKIISFPDGKSPDYAAEFQTEAEARVCLDTLNDKTSYVKHGRIIRNPNFREYSEE